MLPPCETYPASFRGDAKASNYGAQLRT